MDIPDQFLSKIAQQLSHAGLIEVVQGSRGGMRLAVSPEKISLLDVVEAVMGEIVLNDCLRSGSCNRSMSCATHRVWERARKQLRATLRQATFAKLLKEDSCFGN
jgi:Rrf2 family protein